MLVHDVVVTPRNSETMLPLRVNKDLAHQKPRNDKKFVNLLAARASEDREERDQKLQRHFLNPKSAGLGPDEMKCHLAPPEDAAPDFASSAF